MLSSEEISGSENALWYGLFPTNDEALSYLREQATLSNVVDYPHVTFGYKVEPPKDIDWNAIYDVCVTGYGNDCDNEGFSVEIPQELEQFYYGAEVPHITLSVSDKGRPVDTALIDFSPIEYDMPPVPMKFGYFSRGEFFI